MEKRFKLQAEIEKSSKEDNKKVLEKTRDKLEKERTMNLSIKEGSFTSAMSGLGDSYVTPYALTLNANNAQIGFLSSFVGLISPLSQLFGSRLMEKYPRKKIIVIFVLFQALVWIPILLLSFLLWKNLLVKYLPILLILFYSLYAVFGAVAGPSWFSLLGDIVPEKIRGKYFSKRNRINGSVALISTLIAAFLLDYFKTKGLILIGFSILFFLACIFRLISDYLFSKHYDPEFKLQDGYFFSIFQFAKKSTSNNFGKFVIFVSLINLATAIAGPFFTVYMLKDLHFSYTTFMLVNISSSIFSLLSFPLWGRISDKYGNRELLRIGSVLVPFLPIFWLVSSSPYYLAFVPQLIGGIGWAAFNFGASNFIFDSVSPQRRGLCVAYYNIFVGIGIFIGASLGGLLANYLSISFMNKLLFIFLISGITRLLIVFIFLPLIREIREVKEAKRNPVLYFKELMPMKGVVYELGHNLTKFTNKIGSLRI